MSGWSGFTDEELSRIQSVKIDNRPDLKASGKSATLGIRKSKTKEKMVSLPQRKKQAAKSEESVDVVGNPPKATSMAMSRETTFEQSSDESKPIIPINDEIEAKTENNKAAAISMSNVETEIPGLLSDEKAAEMELTSLELMQKRQKEIEAENIKKKQLIKNAIEERYKKAQAETQVLQHVQKELGKLDQRLASDVELLRVRIEEASIDYHHAEKRYEKAECEFIAAKTDLHSKGEVKDDLTHHLFTIIRENEERKAKKLEEIMNKLKLEGDYEIPSSPVECTPKKSRIQMPLELPPSNTEHTADMPTREA